MRILVVTPLTLHRRYKAAHALGVLYPRVIRPHSGRLEVADIAGDDSAIMFQGRGCKQNVCTSIAAGGAQKTPSPRGGERNGHFIFQYAIASNRASSRVCTNKAYIGSISP
jgi:hypothetical protein